VSSPARRKVRIVDQQRTTAVNTLIMTSRHQGEVMTVRLVAAGIALLLSLSACGSKADTLMPSVQGMRLDVALSEIKSAGFAEDVSVDSPGLFGVVDESNWQVCGQTPEPGAVVTEPPTLTVDRTCGGAEESSPSASAEPTESPATESPVAESSPPAQVLTPKNSKEFAAILVEGDYCANSIAVFAKKHAGQVVEFDASIADMARYGDTTTRYDILIAPGDKGSASTKGPAFQFRDVNILDLNLTGADVPDSVGVDDRLHVVASVDAFEPASCLFFLEPIETTVR
jgi:hypothetical protein